MSRLWASSVVAALWVTFGSGPTPSAHAQALRAVADSAAGPKDDAKAAFDEGEQAFEDGDFEAAEAAFRKANALVPHPNTAYNLGLTLQQAGDLGAAWMVFHGLEEGAEDPTVRRDSENRLGQLEKRVAVMHIRARPAARLCVDGRAIEYRPEDEYLVAVSAGSHTLVMDDQHLDLDVETDRHYVLEVTSKAPPPQRPGLVPGLLVGSTAGGLLAVGLGAGALATRGEPQSTGFVAGSVSSAVVGTGLAVAALAIYFKQRRQAKAPQDGTRTPSPAAMKWDCPVAADEG